MPRYRVQVASTSWSTYEVETATPGEAAKLGWSGIDEEHEIDYDGRIDDVDVYAEDDRFHLTPLEYDDTEGEADDEEEEPVDPNEPKVAGSSGTYIGTFCLSCMKDTPHEKDTWYTQAEIDHMILFPGYRVLCSRCHKVLSTPEQKGEESE